MGTEYRSTSRAELMAAGFSRERIEDALACGAMIRARRGTYLSNTTPSDIVRAARVGGRLTCLSLLTLLGVFVMKGDGLHVHMTRTSGRMRSPHDSRKRLATRDNRRGVRVHWLAPAVVPEPFATTAHIVDALAHSVLCQGARAAIASIDSALNKGLITVEQLEDVFALLPSRFAVLRPLIDGRAESGPETLMRLMLRGLGVEIELQVVFHGVGRVDLVVDGWLVIECDSEKYHAGWANQEQDRARDLALAALGYTTLRPTAAAIMWRPDTVLAAVRGLLEARAA